MKNSSDTIVNRTRERPTCSLNLLRHRVPLTAHITCSYSHLYFIFVKNWVHRDYVCIKPTDYTLII